MPAESDWVDLSLGPMAVEWNVGTLPTVDSVPYDCVIVLWSKGYIGMVFPHGDELNPLRWANDHYMPQWGTGSPTGWWTWVKRGSKPRPANVQLWGEKYPPETSNTP